MFLSPSLMITFNFYFYNRKMWRVYNYFAECCYFPCKQYFPITVLHCYFTFQWFTNSVNVLKQIAHVLFYFTWARHQLTVSNFTRLLSTVRYCTAMREYCINSQHVHFKMYYPYAYLLYVRIIFTLNCNQIIAVSSFYSNALQNWLHCFNGVS